MANPGDRSGIDADGAKTVYDRLKNDRAPYVTRAEKNAQYTIPGLFPKDSDDGSTNYATPYQSVGARGMNNLSAKMVLSVYPVGQPFSKLAIGEFDLKEQAAGDNTVMTQAQVGLSMVERICMAWLEAAQFRPLMVEGMKQSLLAGNFMLYMPPGEVKTKLYRLNNYVVERDSNGAVIQTVAVDKMSYGTLPQELKDKLGSDSEYDQTSPVEVYTHCYRDPDSDGWLEYQEIDGEVMQGTENTFPEDGNPWIPVRLYKNDGEHYGRSFVEEYLGDLVSLENLSKAIVQLGLASSKILFLVKPGSQTSVRRFAKAATGDFIPGQLSDIEVFQLQKYADMQVTEKVMSNIEQRLALAFLLNSAVQRNAERVTAEEIRFVSQELESTLGGVYSMLANELQLPVMKRLLVELQATSKIPDLPPGALKPQIITGIDAIGRGQDANKLAMFQSMIAPFMNMVSQRVDWDSLLIRAADAAGLDPSGLIMSEEQMRKKMAEQAAQQGMLNAGAAAGTQAGAQFGAAATDPEAMAASMG